MKTRALFACLSGMALLAAIGERPSFAQTTAFPTRPLRLLVTVPPGGAMDSVGRLVSAQLSPVLGQPMVVENRPGASGQIANEFVARSAPDGHTLLLMGSSQPMVEASALNTGRKLPYDTLRDFNAISQLAVTPFVLAVRADSPIRSAREFVERARAKPGSISYGSSGVGRTDHISGALFASAAGVELLHVPFKGLGPVLQSMLSGDVQATFGALPPMVPLIKSGKLRPLAVVGGSRISLYPDLPTLAEAAPAPGYEVTSWIGMLAAAGTPRPVVDRLNGAVVRLVKDPKFIQDALGPQGLEPVGSTPEQLMEVIRREIVKYTRVFKEQNIVFE